VLDVRRKTAVFPTKGRAWVAKALAVHGAIPPPTEALLAGLPGRDMSHGLAPSSGAAARGESRPPNEAAVGDHGRAESWQPHVQPLGRFGGSVAGVVSATVGSWF
jgi:hypothetical protein